MRIEDVSIPPPGAHPRCPKSDALSVFRLVEEVALTPEMLVAALEYEPGRVPTLRSLKERLERQFIRQNIPEDRLPAVVDQAIQQGWVKVDYAGPVSQAPNPWALRISRPATVMTAEATLSPSELQRLAENVERLLSLAPELTFTFRVILTTEGERPSADVLARLNEVLDQVQRGWRLS